MLHAFVHLSSVAPTSETTATQPLLGSGDVAAPIVAVVVAVELVVVVVDAMIEVVPLQLLFHTDLSLQCALLEPHQPHCERQ